MNRRHFLLTTVCSSLWSAPGRYTIGITTNTRGGWEKDVWLSFREAREVGYRHVETFIHYFQDLFEKNTPEPLEGKMQALGLRFVTISNGAPMEMHFEDPAKHEKIIEEHLRLVRFIKKLGCTHLKINMGPRRPGGTTQEDLKHMVAVTEEIGRRTTAEGLKFAPHAHMWSQLENRGEVEYLLSHTSPQNVYFVLDTGHITMAGMDPVQLARELGHRIVEFHLKDVAREHRGGAKHRIERPDMMKHPVFFALGTGGGVDFPALKAHLDSISWRGYLTVELDSSPMRPPKESARISREYLERTLGLRMQS